MKFRIIPHPTGPFPGEGREHVPLKLHFVADASEPEGGNSPEISYCMQCRKEARDVSMSPSSFGQVFRNGRCIVGDFYEKQNNFLTALKFLKLRKNQLILSGEGS